MPWTLLKYAGPRVVLVRALLAPRRQELPVLVELRHARPVVAVRDDEAAVGEPVHVGRPVEMRGVGARHAVGADRQELRLAVVAELVDHVLVIVDEPDVLVRVVRADRDEVRTLQARVPLHPVGGLRQQVALAVEHEDAVLPARVHAHLVVACPGFHAALGELAAAAVAGRARGRRVTPRQPADRERDARPEVRQLLRHRTRNLRQLAALHDVDAVRALGKHALARAERPALVAGIGAELLRPAGERLRTRRRRPARLSPTAPRRHGSGRIARSSGRARCGTPAPRQPGLRPALMYLRMSSLLLS